jgi:type VII secretion integral membrane protein EccD
MAASHLCTTGNPGIETGLACGQSESRGSLLPVFDPGLRRVSVHAGTCSVDLSLPAGMPVAMLIPAILDILDDRDAERFGPAAARYQLSCPGIPALPGSMTLEQSGIRDGAVLVLSHCRTEPPAPRCDDMAEAVAAALDTDTRLWNRRATRLTGAVAASAFAALGGLLLIRNTWSANTTGDRGSTAWIAAITSFVALLGGAVAQRAYRDPIAGLAMSGLATAFAAVAGFLAVPGSWGVPNALLAAIAAASTSVLAMRVTGCGVVTLTAVSCFAIAVAVAASAGVVAAAAAHAIGSVSAVVSLALLGIAGRASIVLAGLSPQPSALDPEAQEPDADCLATKAIRADNWLTSLRCALSAAAAIGAIVTVVTGRGSAPRLGCIAFGAVTGALLLLRARSIDTTTTLVFVVGGIATIGTTFAVTAVGMPERGPWIAATAAMLVAAALYLSFVAPAVPFSPVARRGVELLECLALVAMVPLTCWICGLYGAVRGLNLA